LRVKKSVTVGLPSVTVPVLSKTIVLDQKNSESEKF
jgi:hypothetical protein